MVKLKVAFATSNDNKHLGSDDKALLEQSMDKWDNHIVVWNDPNVKWDNFDCVIIRSVWDYVQNYQEFQEWLKTLGKVKCLNHPDVLKWNSSKEYLMEIHKGSNIPLIPTITAFHDKPHKSLIDYINQGKSSGIFDQQQVEFVFKPVIGANGYRANRFNINNWYSYQPRFSESLSSSNVIIQPFVETILSEGETSFIFFNGRFSHCVVKRPRIGDFRVQEDYGGTVEAIEPNEKGLMVANQIIKYLMTKFGKILYARIDMMNFKGQFCLSECEMLEPTLYFLNDRAIAKRFIDAVESQIEMISPEIRPQSLPASSDINHRSSFTCIKKLNANNTTMHTIKNSTTTSVVDKKRKDIFPPSHTQHRVSRASTICSDNLPTSTLSLDTQRMSTSESGPSHFLLVVD